MKRKVFFLAFIVLLFSSCNGPHWHKTAEGYYVYDDTNDKYISSWNGPVYQNFVKGVGQYSIYNDEGKELSHTKVKADYGVLDGWTYFPYEEGKYIGETKKKTPHGIGVLIRNDTIFYGKFKKGKLYSGDVHISIITGKEGCLLYQGKMKKGKYHSYGDLYEAGKLIYSGGWEKGYRSGLGEEYGEDTIIYSGSFKRNERCGLGKSFVHGNLEYDGEWKEGLYNGEGTLYNENQMPIYEGNWKMGLYHGKGKLYEKGQCIEAKFDKGRRVKDYSVSPIQQIKRTTKRIFNSSDTTMSEDSVEEIEEDAIAMASSQQEFVESMIEELSEKAKTSFDKRVDKRFGFWNILRMINQPIFKSNIKRADKAQKFFCKDLLSEDIEKWINVKIDYYNSQNDDKLQYVQLDEIRQNDIVNVDAAKLIFDRESMESADVITDILVKIIICIIIGFIIVFILGIALGEEALAICGIIDFVLGIIAFVVSLIISVHYSTEISMQIETSLKQVLLDNYMSFIDGQNVVAQMLGMI